MGRPIEPGDYISRMRQIVVRVATVAAAAALLSQTAACIDSEQSKKLAESFQAPGTHPDEPPTMLNKELPFHYPPALYARKVQGNVELRLYVDADGHVRNDSTRVETSSGYGSLDSAAVRGSQDLRFVPAKLHGEPVAVSILFPVYFRHPDAPPLPGDTILRRGPRDTGLGGRKP